MWDYIMASSWGMPLKGMKSWEVVDVVVVAMVGDGRDVVAIGTESDVMGSNCSCDIRIEGNSRNTIRIISIITIIIIIYIIIISIIIVICSEDGRDSGDMIRSRYVQMRWCETTVYHQRDIGARDEEVRKAIL
jgi:hypothetical protein